MNFLRNKNIQLILIALMTGALLWACKDDDLPLSGGTDSPVPEDGYFLTFKVNLESMTRDASPRAMDFEKYEDYIDPSNFRVLFFSDEKKGNNDTLIRQFRADKADDGLSLIPIEASGSSFSKDWYVRIPIKDKDEEFAQKLRDQNFKVAVLANWPVSTPDLEMGDKIKKLHHLSADSTYIKNDSYSFLLDSEYEGMGMSVGWINDQWGGRDAANNWIRENWNPMSKNRYNPNLAPVWKDYEDLWLLWNFEGGCDEDTTCYDPKIVKTAFLRERWAYKNHWDMTIGDINNPHNWLQDQDKLSDISIENDAGLFRYIGPDGYFGKPIDTSDKEIDGPRGIILTSKNNDKGKTNVIKFMLPTSGQLRIKWGSANGKDAGLKIERRNYDTDSTPKEVKNPSKSKNPVATDYTWNITITGDSEILWIYSREEDVIIYEIEYIQGQYLYDTDRQGKTLNDQLIPMYGIENYKALEDWAPGTVFDLSNFNHISSPEQKVISMIRSVAKVELLIPISEQPHHVYLRSQNRASRCEPMDVFTPTSEIWKDHANTEESHSKWCEFFTIKGHSPFYNPDTSSASDSVGQWNNYRSKLAWYYGNWATNGKIGEVTIDPAGSTEAYPQLMNPRINRSDFNEFINTGISDGVYQRYVLYVPEKFVDDPSEIGQDKGMETSLPKVCHIEFRTKNYPHNNLDDNGCYRIYFTENGFYDNNGQNKYPSFGKIKDENGKDTSIDETWENSYEQNVENLKHHWPIIRNHKYTFTVIDANSRIVVAKLEILPWRMVEENNSYNW